MNLVICNIGSSDLDRKLLPELRELSERERAARILADYAGYRDQLRLPIIGKALRYVQGWGGDLACVVLVASHQYDEEPQDEQARHDWHTDTCQTAEVVRRCLADGSPPDWQAVPLERVQIWLIADEQGGSRDPSDYDGVRRFLERQLPRLADTYPQATAFLEVTGGTPAMTTGLLVAGTEVFGARAEVMYVHPRHALPHTLNTGRRLQARPLRAALRSNVQTYAYDVALRTLHEQRSAIIDRLEQGAPEVLRAVLAYARCRFNFDFPGARQALQGGVDRHGDGRWQADIHALYDAVDQPGHWEKLAEIYHGAAARYAVGSYADFLTQVVRFEENLLRVLCLARGAVFVDRQGRPDADGALIQRVWLRAQPFALTRDQDDGRDRLTGRAVLRDLLEHLTAQHGEDLSPLLTALDRVKLLVWLRNDLTHSFEGVRKIDLARRFAGNQAQEAQADAIVPHLAHIYEQAAGKPPGQSPFAVINRLVDRLLHEAADKRGGN